MFTSPEVRSRPLRSGFGSLALILAFFGSAGGSLADEGDGETIPLLVKTRVPLTPDVAASIGAQAVRITHVWPEIDALALLVDATKLTNLSADPLVAFVETDQQGMALGQDRDGQLGPAAPAVMVPLLEALGANTTWYSDMANASCSGCDGTGVTVAVVDSGLPRNWEEFLPPGSVDLEHAAGFGGEERGDSRNPVQAIRGLDGEIGLMPHGLAVAGLIVGFRSEVGSIGGASPGARILPVRVLDPFNRGWYSWFTAGILHVARLKATGELPGPVVINFSIQGRGDSAVMTSAIDYAISQGVLFVTFAGTLEPDSSAPGYPGRLTQSITAEATGWAQEGFSFADWLFGPGMTVGQDLSLDPVRRFVFGTSFAAPRTSGIVARLLQSNPGLTQEEASVILHAAAPMTAGQHGSWKGFRFVAPWATPAVEHGLVHDNVYRIPKRYDCTSLNYDFMDAVRQARRCDASLPVVQCNLVVDDSLDCPCLTFVNPANVAAISLMEIVRSVWYSWHCDWGIICGAQACPQIYGSTCVPTVGASGQCIVY